MAESSVSLFPQQASFAERYSNSIRFRFAYYGIMNTAIIASLVIGACLQMFFTILCNHTSQATLTKAQESLIFIMTPILFWIGALICDEFVDLCYDSIDNPPLRNFRILIATVFFGGSRRLADVAMIAIFEIVPIIVSVVLNFCLKEPRSFKNFLVNYVIGALLCNLAAVSTQLFCSVIVSTVNHFYLQYEKLEESLTYTNLPSTSRAPLEQSDELQFFEQGVKSRKARKKLSMSQINPCYSILVVMLVVGMLCLVVYYVDTSQAACLAALVLSLLGLSIATTLLVPKLLGTTYYAMALLFAVLTFNLLFLNETDAFIGVYDAVVRNSHVPPLLPAPHNAKYRSQSTHNVYPVCMMRWGGPGVADEELKLTAVDLAGFAYATYLPDHFESMLTNLTQNTALDDFHVEHIEEVETVGGWAIVKLPRSKIVVFAIRGTASLDDALADMDMFSNVAILQLADKFVPILQLLPREIVRKIVGILVFRKFFGVPRIWDHTVAAAIETKKKAEAEGYEMITTGHSLGGVLAAMVGATTSSPALAFSPPGEDFNVERFGFAPESFQRNVVLVQPIRDVVPRVDGQLGLRQQISCSSFDPGECHHIARSQCELVRICGDPRGRKPNLDESHCAGAMTLG